MIDSIICHYSEIGLKGGNRGFFEKTLIQNIKKKIEPSFFFSVEKISGRILVNLTSLGRENREDIIKSLKLVFGISDFLLSVRTTQEIQKIGEISIALLEKEKFKTFVVRSKRSEKEFSLTSQQINEDIGAIILKKIGGISVKLKEPDITCFIEIVGKNSFISVKKIKGQGGLPVGTGGRVISLLSGGIDSPVASFMTMSRGVKIIFIHFYSYPETSKSSIDKVRELVRVLSRYQGESKLYLVPFSKAQKEILVSVKAANRVIFYRRLMFRITLEIAKKERALGIVTGESLGQVASQTIENIASIERGVNLPIIRPLICTDKDGIIKKAREIGTYDISILPHSDSCARFLPRHPETRSSVEIILKEEEGLDIDKILNEAMSNISCEVISK